MAKPTLIISFSPPHGQEKTVEAPQATFDPDAGHGSGLENITIGEAVTCVDIFRGAEGADFAQYVEAPSTGRAQILLADIHVSRERHARIRWDPATEEWVLEDMGSTNGTWVVLGDDAREKVWKSRPYPLPVGHYSIHAGYDLEVIVS